MHARRLSDFGSFVSSSSKPVPAPTRLESTDLLGSFDDVPSTPLHIQLPPRPDEIAPDYIPPKRYPRRMSQPYMTAGPSSPPSVNSAGHEIIFHPDAVPDTRPSVLLDTLTTTAKAASKWRRSLDQSRSEDTEEITHDNPFISPEQLAGTYIPPSGAPGFQEVIVNRHHTLESNAQLALNGRRPATTPVLDVPAALSLQRHLPARHRLSKHWTLVFSLDQHGASLASLYRHAEMCARNSLFGTLLIVQDGQGHRFGAFLNEPLSKREGYFGTGEAFLFKVDVGAPAVFRWTGKNQYFALCETSFISFGGGSGAYGLILDATFSKSSSATCPTFDNEVLCTQESRHADKATYFDCVGLEIWATTML